MNEYISRCYGWRMRHYGNNLYRVERQDTNLEWHVSIDLNSDGSSTETSVEARSLYEWVQHMSRYTIGNLSSPIVVRGLLEGVVSDEDLRRELCVEAMAIQRSIQ